MLRTVYFPTLRHTLQLLPQPGSICCIALQCPSRELHRLAVLRRPMRTELLLLPTCNCTSDRCTASCGRLRKLLLCCRPRTHSRCRGWSAEVAPPSQPWQQRPQTPLLLYIDWRLKVSRRCCFCFERKPPPQCNLCVPPLLPPLSLPLPPPSPPPICRCRCC